MSNGSRLQASSMIQVACDCLGWNRGIVQASAPNSDHYMDQKPGCAPAQVLRMPKIQSILF